MKIRPTFITHCDDGSTLFEWCYKKEWRFGISIEKNKRESSWYFVMRYPIMAGTYLLPKKLRGK
jgi:hypothetical protein